MGAGASYNPQGQLQTEQQTSSPAAQGNSTSTPSATAPGTPSPGSTSPSPATGDPSSFLNGVGGNSSLANAMTNPQNVATNQAAYGSQAMPAAAQFQQQLFNPGVNSMEQSFMDYSQNSQQKLLNDELAKLGNQFSGSPMNSGYLGMARDLGAQAAQNLGGTASQLALQRQGLANQTLGNVLGNPTTAAVAGQTSAGNLLNTISGLQNDAAQLGTGYLGSSPIFAPSVVSPTQSAGGGKK